MDNFMEKLTHKFSATDMIKANSQADAAELDSKKEQLALFEAQMEKVDGALSDIRQLNLKNIESVNDVQNLAKSSSDEIAKTADASIAGINKTVDESLAKIEQIKEASGSVEAINQNTEIISDKIIKMRGDLEEYLHADHVKIYRNVQTAVNEELEKKTAEIIAEAKKNRKVLPIVVITLIISLADLAINILRMLGII